MSFLKGYNVLDLASVGPAARASRILADYGMNIIKVAPVAAKGAKQDRPGVPCLRRGTRHPENPRRPEIGRGP